MELGKLQKVNLRDVWKHEALDFTNWLAEEQNLELLSDEIGIGIKLIQTEASVGRYNVDILAEEENSNTKIVIENQLEPTDHDHLGKIITYASGHDAEIIIWIVQNVRDEHKQAVDWLNEHTNENLNFFLLKIEAWQIENSKIAPHFHTVSKPNDWAKAVRTSSRQKVITEAKAMQLEFWNKFKEYATKEGTKLKLRKTYPKHWYDISIGSSFGRIALTINTKENLIGCELYIDKSKELFYFLQSMKTEIETEIGTELNWMELPNRKSSRIIATMHNSIENTEKWEEYFEWLLETSEKFYRVFPKKIKEYPPC